MYTAEAFKTLCSRIDWSSLAYAVSSQTFSPLRYRGKGHVGRDRLGRGTLRLEGTQTPCQRWATAPRDDGEEPEECRYGLDSVWCCWTFACRSYFMLKMWEMVALPRASSPFLSSRTRWQQCRRTVHAMAS